MQTIKMDFQSQSTPPVVPVMQSDAQSRFIGITLYDGGVPYSAPSGAQYTVQYRGSGANNMGWYDTIQLSSGTRKAVVVSSSSPNVVTLELAEQALRVNGKVEVSLCVVNNTGYKLNTFPIICRVTGAPYVDPVAVRSYFYVTGLTSEQWLAYVTACQDAQKRAEDAAATFETDPTLSVEGKAADAKATGEVKEDLKSESKTAESSFLSDTIPLFVPHSQGRWIEADSGQIEKEVGASESVTSIRVRTDLIVSYPYPVTVQTFNGYLFSAYYVDADEKKVDETDWGIALTIPQNINFALTVKKSDSGALDSAKFYNYIKITMCNPNLYSFVYGTGGYVATSFNDPVSLNTTGAAVSIRKHIPFAIDRPFRCTVPSGYIVSVICLLPNGNYGGEVEYNGEKTFDVYCKNALVSMKKEDNSDISFSDCNDIKIEYIDGFAFEGGSTDTSSGKWVANNSAEALNIRVRTPIMSIGKTCEIICKEGYSISVDECLEDGTFVNSPYNTSYFSWVKRCVLQGQKYYSIVIKRDDGSSLFASNVSDYIIHDFETYDLCTARMKEYKVLYIGDSITENNYTAVSNWTKRVTGAFDFADTDNVAMGGTGIIAGGENGWLKRIKDFPIKDYDLILVMGNMNDYSNNIFDENSLGKFGDETAGTEYGALTLFVRALTEKYKKSKVGWIISTPRQYYSGDNDNPNPITEDGALYGKKSIFENATKAIKDVCEQYSIPCLDLFHNSNFRCWDKSTKEQYFYNDGNMVHPNDEGNKLMAIKIVDFVNRNF